MSNHKVMRNASMLYIRMLVMLFVSLYTSRIVLNTLGVSDFGIYNVTGGIVIMFSFISNTMASASQRFFAYEIGSGDLIKLKKMFSVTLAIYIIFAIIIIILAESLGLWFVTTKLNIPNERFEAALFVYQASIISFVFTIIRIPYNSLIIAYEKMSFFASTSITEAILKLIGVYSLTLLSLDKLKLYAVIMLIVVALITLVYYIFCRKNFQVSKFTLVKEPGIYKELSAYAGWNSFTTLANIGLDQGINILLNVFFGPAINAARGIAFQIKTQVTSFVGNIQMAAAPQIIKYHAANKSKEMERLVYLSSRVTYYFMFLIGLPVILQTDTLLTLWLVNVPPHAVAFTQLVIINILIETISGTVNSAIQASGRIKAYQISVGIVLLLALPISYLCLNIGMKPEVTVIITSLLSVVCVLIRLLMFKILFKINLSTYIKKVFVNSLLVSLISSILPFMVRKYCMLKYLNENVIFIIVSFSCVISTLITIYFIGLTRDEKKYLAAILKTKFKR
ncbi:lipopolysaccharide biosynthesis protein [Klebsiella sp. MISC125]|uniref:lipopolysaccharide biosynthesis protein n=1 Tax=Klebsiella sp. MISC125 TaxID=2755386 RepID=UPI003DAA3812